jgi:hypothetical protein
MGSNSFRVATIEVSLQEKYSGESVFRLAGPVNSGPAVAREWFGMRLAIEPTVSYNRNHGGGLKAWASYPIIPS